MKTIRLIIFEWLLGWALSVVPKDSPEATEFGVFMSIYLDKRIREHREDYIKRKAAK